MQIPEKRPARNTLWQLRQVVVAAQNVFPSRRSGRRRVARSAAFCGPEILEGRCVLSGTTPAISIADTRVVEADTGTSIASVAVTLDSVSSLPVTVNYTTRNNLAMAGADYQATTGALTIPAGTLRASLSISVSADVINELSESFSVVLSSPLNATLARTTATVTIQDNDAAPSISVGDLSVVEGGLAAIKLRLSQVSSLPVTVSYRTENLTALGNLDFVPLAGKVVIPPGANSATITVATKADVLDEVNESFLLNLSGSLNATIADTQASVTILDDDPPAVSAEDTWIVESQQGLRTTVYTVIKITSKSTVPITVSYQTRNAMAVRDRDYLSSVGQVTIPAGGTYARVALTVLDDVLNEFDETFEVVLSLPINATLGKSVGKVTIRDNDPLPVLSIANTNVTEGATGTSIVVSLSAISGRPVFVDYFMRPRTATSGVDFVSLAGNATIPAGQLSVMIPITSLQDTVDEPDEAFQIILSSPAGANLAPLVGQWQGIVTILDDENGPQLPLFELSDMAYLGAFQVPTGRIGSSSFEFGGNALTFNPATNSLFMASDTNAGLNVAEVAIPAQLGAGGRLSQMPIGRVLQPFVNLGRLLTVNSAGETLPGSFDYEHLNLGGLLVAGGGLTGGVFAGYTDAEPQRSTHSHFRTSGLNLSTLKASDVSGLLDIRRYTSHTDGRSRGGYMAEVPALWRDYIGADYVTGASGQNRIQFSSVGPALFGFNATNPEASSGVPLVSYPYGRALQWSDIPGSGPQPLFNGTTKIEGVAFVPGTRSVIFLGSNGLSSIGYGDGSLFNDTARPYSGFHSQNGVYRYQLWAYDIESFAPVRNGTTAAWAVKPTSVFNFDLPTPEPAKYLGGSAFDAKSGRLYISQKLAGNASTPVIHVYQLGRPQVSPSQQVVASSVSSPVILSSGAASLPSSSLALRSTTTLTSALSEISVADSGAATTTTRPQTSGMSSMSTQPVALLGETLAQSLSPELSAIDAVFESLSLDLTVLR